MLINSTWSHKTVLFSINKVSQIKKNKIKSGCIQLDYLFEKRGGRENVEDKEED